MNQDEGNTNEHNALNTMLGELCNELHLLLDITHRSSSTNEQVSEAAGHVGIWYNRIVRLCIPVRVAADLQRYEETEYGKMMAQLRDMMAAAPKPDLGFLLKDTL